MFSIELAEPRISDIIDLSKQGLRNTKWLENLNVQRAREKKIGI